MKKIKHILGIAVCLVSFMYGVLCIDIQDGRYRNINIVIQNTVKEDDVLIERIKEIFVKASKFLFEATRRHVYFGNIKIIIPKSWNEKTEYKKISAIPKSDPYIMVDDGNVKAPHTKRMTNECGTSGLYMYLPASFVLQKGKTDYGNHENVLVHEFGHLRWGLWDEYGRSSTNGTNKEFYPENGQWKPVGCSKSVEGVIGDGPQCIQNSPKCDTTNISKEMNKSCRFCPYPSQKTNLSSIMAYNWLDEVTTFCDNDRGLPLHQRHNRNSLNEQNEMCNLRSCWEVMRDHSDFKSAVALPALTNTTPIFEILQQTVGYRVLTLDTSGSMGTKSRLLKLVQACVYIIKTKIPEYSWLGIVWFNTTASVVKHLTQLTPQRKRTDFLTALPNTAFGSTCIGCGIDKSLNHLQETLGDHAGAEIIVISDGEDNTGNLRVSIQNAIDANVIIHSLSVSQDADTRMINMATASGGKHVSYLEAGTISITSALLEILSSAQISDSTAFVTLVSEFHNVDSGEGVETSFNIDSDIGNFTSVSIIQEKTTYLHVNVSGPNGISYAEETTGDSFNLNIPDKAVAGHYTVKITTNVTSLELHVTSSPTNMEAIRAYSWIYPVDFDFSLGTLPVIVVDVMKGRAAVSTLNVTAVVEAANASLCVVSLIDDGLDPDVNINDGIYTGVIPAYCIGGDGRVIAKVYVQGKAGKTSVQDFYSGAGSQNLDQDDTFPKVLRENFQRVVVTNEILVRNYTVTDVTAPGRIRDVLIIDISTETSAKGKSRNLTITWTATGDDVNIGQATEYELRISSDNEVLVNNFSSADFLNISNVSFTPTIAGLKEFIKLEINAEESFTSTVYFAVRVRDEAGNVGPVSNIISLLVSNKYRMAIKGYLVYSHGIEDDKKAIDTDERHGNFKLAIGLSITAVTLLTIFAVILLVKNSKARKVVRDYEYGVQAPTATVSKMVFQSAQLKSHAERQQNNSRPCDSFPKSFHHDTISQSSCRIEMFINGEIIPTFNKEILDNDNTSICSGSTELSNKCFRNLLPGEEFIHEHAVKVELDILPGEIN